MAALPIRAESARANNFVQFDIAYYEYRHARAAWNAVIYAPEHLNDDVPDEIDVPLSRAHTEALKLFLLSPCRQLQHLALKLQVFRDEDVHGGLDCADEIVDALVRDAAHLVGGR